MILLIKILNYEYEQHIYIAYKMVGGSGIDQIFLTFFPSFS